MITAHVILEGPRYERAKWRREVLSSLPPTASITEKNKLQTTVISIVMPTPEGRGSITKLNELGYGMEKVKNDA